MVIGSACLEMKDDYIYSWCNFRTPLPALHDTTRRTAHDTTDNTGMTDALVNIGDVCCLLTCSNPRIIN
jgi:hypothetical protein